MDMYSSTARTHFYITLPVKDFMVEFESHIPCNFLHTSFHVILEVLLSAEELRDFTAVKDHVRTEKDELEEQMPAKVHESLAVAQVRAVHEGPRSPTAHDLDSIDRRSKVLIVALNNTHVASDEDKLSRPFLFIPKNLPNALSHLLLHLVMSLLLFLDRHGPLDPSTRAIVSTGVGPHKSC